MAANRWARLGQRPVFFACEAFILQGQVTDWIAKEFKERFDEDLHRTQVYDVIREGVRRGYVQLVGPRDELLTERMLDRFVRARNTRTAGGTGGPGSGAPTPSGKKDKMIQVVSQGSEVSLVHVAVAAAQTAFQVIVATYEKLLAEARKSRSGSEEKVAVHVGFGGGGTTNLVARYLAELLRSAMSPPRLVLHALTSGFNVSEPENAPGSFFSYFQGIRDVSFRGLFAPAYVKAEDWDGTLELVGVRESFAEKPKLHVIITALASARDPHGELNRFMELNPELGLKTRRILDDEEKRVGDVMYRPFSDSGPITKQVAIRAVTLFEPAELVTFAAQENKAVILVAGPCADPNCRRSRSDALLPLLQEPSLDVWSHLVTDDVTALECLEAPPRGRS